MRRAMEASASTILPMLPHFSLSGTLSRLRSVFFREFFACELLTFLCSCDKSSDNTP